MTQTDIWSDVYVADISDSDMDSFKQLVISDIKGQLSEDDKSILLNNLELWNYHLQILRRDMELQLSCQKAKTKLQINSIDSATELEIDDIKNFINEQNKWRMSALKFLSNIERKTLYVKLLISDSQKYSS